MISFPSRGGVLTLALAAGLFSTVQAQTPSADEMVHTNASGRHFAPHDTFYMLTYTSARTDKGVEGFEPGAEVHLVSVNREAHTLTVTDGHAQVEIPPDKLTNDMDIATIVRAKDQAKQAQIAAYQEAEAKAYQEYEKQAADYTAKDLEKRQQEQRDADTRAQAQVNATAAQAAPQTSASFGSGNGYYNEGGLGYGNPYGYFANLTPTNVNGSGRGAVSTQNTIQPANGQATVTSGGARSSGGGQAAGGKKP